MFSKVLQLHAIKRGPLSLFRTSGIPCLEKIAMSLEIVDLAEVDVTISTSGKQLYLSMTSVRYSPQGSGLGKSIVSSFHGMFGNSVILRGSNRSALLIVAAWYGKQLSTFFTLAIFSIAGNQIICLMRRFGFAIPWYPTCARFTALSLSTFGTTILFPLSSVPW